MATTPPTDPNEPAIAPTDEGRPSWRAPVVLAGLVALVVVIVIAAMLVLDGDDDGTDVTLVGLIGGELVHVDEQGEIVETFPLGADRDTEELVGFRPIGHHWVAAGDGEVVTIDARGGEVTRHRVDIDGQIAVERVRGTRSVVSVGAPNGRPTLVLIDLDSGERVKVDADGDDAIFLPEMTVGSVDGDLVAAVDMRRGPNDDPTHLVDMATGETTRLSGYPVGITDARVVQRTTDGAPSDDPSVHLQFLDHSGEETSTVRIDLGDRPVSLSDGRVLLVAEDGVRLVEDGDSEPERVLSRALGEVRYAIPLLEDRRVLVSADDGTMLLLDADGEEIAELELAAPHGPSAVDPQHRCVALGFPGQEAAVVDLETGDLLSDGSARVAGYSLTADTCAVVLDDGRVTTLDGEVDSIERPEATGVQAVSPDGRTIVVLDRDGSRLITADGETHTISSEPGRFAYIDLG